MYNVQCTINNKKNINSEKGQTLIELIVVISVSVIVVGALVFATIASLRNSQFSKYQAQATKLAQEGIELARVGRDQNQCAPIPPSVNSWNGNSSNTSCLGSGSIWSLQVTGNCASPPANCYFNVTPNGALTYLGPFTPTPTQSVPSGAQSIPPFSRVIIISDGASYATQKTVTVIVKWTDFSGDHQSQLTTVLGKL